ncbi:MAG TPA: hypothetical protein DHV25_01855 [Candidatus Kerfeldbacteria bacterium]|nr:MAG: hypothetical protein UY34_C0001G0102 [Parcubacteria group bacterium GW2011_GWA2_48_9]KKW16619.1 MAG: hypothetical protein UY52_C0002G0033 [Parcubacteria group bacterium GW2011_GWC2_49_9]HCJ52447.1 hypothetical protein [Candidatus Kerfeldbacteria bacterium]
MAEQQRKILIVEDEKAVRGVLHASLHHAGFEVTETQNGEEAF